MPRKQKLFATEQQLQQALNNVKEVKNITDFITGSRISSPAANEYWTQFLTNLGVYKNGKTLNYTFTPDEFTKAALKTFKEIPCDKLIPKHENSMHMIEYIYEPFFNALIYNACGKGNPQNALFGMLDEEALKKGTLAIHQDFISSIKSNYLASDTHKDVDKYFEADFFSADLFTYMAERVEDNLPKLDPNGLLLDSLKISDYTMQEVNEESEKLLSLFETYRVLNKQYQNKGPLFKIIDFFFGSKEKKALDSIEKSFKARGISENSLNAILAVEEEDHVKDVVNRVYTRDIYWKAKNDIVVETKMHLDSLDSDFLKSNAAAVYFEQMKLETDILLQSQMNITFQSTEANYLRNYDNFYFTVDKLCQNLNSVIRVLDDRDNGIEDDALQGVSSSDLKTFASQLLKDLYDKGIPKDILNNIIDGTYTKESIADFIEKSLDDIITGANEKLADAWTNDNYTATHENDEGVIEEVKHYNKYPIGEINLKHELENQLKERETRVTNIKEWELEEEIEADFEKLKSQNEEVVQDPQVQQNQQKTEEVKHNENAFSEQLDIPTEEVDPNQSIDYLNYNFEEDQEEMDSKKETDNSNDEPEEEFGDSFCC